MAQRDVTPCGITIIDITVETSHIEIIDMFKNCIAVQYDSRNHKETKETLEEQYKKIKIQEYQLKTLYECISSVNYWKQKQKDGHKDKRFKFRIIRFKNEIQNILYRQDS